MGHFTFAHSSATFLLNLVWTFSTYDQTPSSSGALSPWNLAHKDGEVPHPEHGCHFEIVFSNRSWALHLHAPSPVPVRYSNHQSPLRSLTSVYSRLLFSSIGCVFSDYPTSSTLLSFHIRGRYIPSPAQNTSVPQLYWPQLCDFLRSQFLSSPEMTKPDQRILSKLSMVS